MAVARPSPPVTLVLNDWGGAQFLISEGRAERIGRLVLVACEAFDNYPPGLPGKLITLAARIPGGLAAAVKLLRFPAFRRDIRKYGLSVPPWETLLAWADRLKTFDRPVLSEQLRTFVPVSRTPG
ncbi:hypothetical protein SAMN05421835_121118 [Amycolatopsis sacchari]|uniref:Uncharacterized protein n=1 Tax=Amycolatopsis sacchari TaxID=115433 RepID=A0A1I3ZN69_9PSEU|nr:hypothetical protein SAMN05421835_121118 [Amycolatopsis sacchari]